MGVKGKARQLGANAQAKGRLLSQLPRHYNLKLGEGVAVGAGEVIGGGQQPGQKIKSTGEDGHFGTGHE